jgi:secreted protein with Ig-like and vWFA domain
MVDVAETPWQPLHRLVRVALKGREVKDERGPANFVFLVDVSGSMSSEDKLPLVKRSLEMLTRQLGKDDRVAMVVYAGSSGLVLPSTPGSERETIIEALGRLQAGGFTNGAGGITQAYQEAAKNFIKGGVNRVILCTDGDFNVGVSSEKELERLITEKAKSRIFLSVLGFGTGNLKDSKMETLADKGNGNYAYIDSLSEARKVLVEQMNGTLVTIAKDVKIQVEFNPTQVAAYRLLGYENRLMAKEDFNNDKKDAGEIGAGHTVTALYEVVPARVKYPDGRPAVDDLKYAPKVDAPAEQAAPAAPASNELMTVKLRYKQPEGDKSDLMEVPVTDKETKLSDAPKDFQFAASVAGFGMLLRGSQHAGELTWDMVRDMALRGKGDDAQGYRGEFLQLIDRARGLTETRR